MSKKKTKEQFIEEARAVHGDLYDYSKVEYITARSKVEIICSKHGNFFQNPYHHISRRHGCQKCGGTSKLSTAEFIQKARQILGDLYDYSKVKYINAISKFDVICRKHGVFKITASDHTNSKNGCLNCARDILRSSKDEFVAKANIVHHYFYDYSKVVYLQSKIKVEIICPKHGSFHQSPDQHLCRHGCPSCKESKGEKIIRRYLSAKKIEFKQEHIVKTKDYYGRFDFLIKNTRQLIEFNGEQHYCPVNFGNKDKHAKFKTLIRNIKNDYLKYKKCSQNPIELLVVPYWDINRITEILDDFFSGKEPVFSEPPKKVKEFEPVRKKIREKLGIKIPEILCGMIKNEKQSIDNLVAH